MAYVLEARSDARFQQTETKARQKLLMMIEQADAAKFSSYAGAEPVRTGAEYRLGFRIGRD